MKLIDRAWAEGVRICDDFIDANHLCELMRRAVIYNVQKVADGFLDLPTGSKVFSDLSSLPNPIPPHETMWLDWHNDSYEWGALVERFPGVFYIPDLLAALGNLDESRAWRSVSEEVQYGTSVSLFTYQPREGVVLGPVVGHHYATDRNYEVIGKPFVVGGSLTKDKEEATGFGLLCRIAPFVFSLLNCKNVKAVDVIPSRQSRKRHRNRYGRDLISYREIKVRVPVLRKPSGNVVGDDGVVPFHLCRGHFKDYREKGLFGKYKGVYWWQAGWRGSRERGTVMKDYVLTSD